MPGSIRLFVNAPLAAGHEIAATFGQAHYLGAVMRRTTGAPVMVFNGTDGEWLTRIATIGRGRASLIVEQRQREQAPEPDLWLAFAPLKRDATDLVVQKATELGAARLLPVMTERTQPGRVAAVRLEAIAIEAAEQCERLTVPVLQPPRRLPDLLADWPAGRRLFAAAERQAAAPLPPIPAAEGPAALLVGPEGGFTPAELDLLGRCAFATLVTLGPRILRAETASIAGLARLQAGR